MAKVKAQAKKLYGVEGTHRTRKQWRKARVRGKVPNQYVRLPNTKSNEVKKSSTRRIN